MQTAEILRLERGKTIAEDGVAPEESRPDISDMVDSQAQVSRLEGEQGGLKQSQSILMMSCMGLGALIFTLAAIMVTLQVFLFQRLDSLEQATRTEIGDLRSEISSVRGELNAEFRGLRTDMAAEARATRQELSAIATAIATGITAARQQPPAPQPTENPASQP